VTDYDVSLADGRVAYVANNQLWLVLPDGSNSRLLIDGGPRENNAWVTNPIFSPDGKTLAYGQKGLNFYDLATGTSQGVIADQLTDPNPDGFRFPIELYWPERFSPDGTKLLVALGHWEVLPSHAIYDLVQNRLVKLSGGDGYGYCCSFSGGPAWSADSSSFYGIASEHDYAFPHGALWKVDAETGAVTTLIPLVARDGKMNFVYEPFSAPDGRLYYFFINYPEPAGDFGRLPLLLFRSAPDGLTDQTVLLPETFRDNEVLWAPDASFFIMTSDDGQAEIIYLDGTIRSTNEMGTIIQELRRYNAPGHTPVLAPYVICYELPSNSKIRQVCDREGYSQIRFIICSRKKSYVF
jgi:Tol biopolymer transport system component